MRKVILQFAVLLATFFLTWFFLNQIPFIDNQSIEKIGRKTEKELGDLLIKSIESSGKEIHSAELLKVIDSIHQKICLRNSFDSLHLKVHILNNQEINAFAMPDDHLVLYSGLIEYCKNQDELAGVIAHEIGHMEKDHVTKKLIKEVGLAMLMTIAGGDAGPEIAKETFRILSSTSFDRKQEREADKFATISMSKAGFDPTHLANFLFRLAQSKSSLPAELEWISTHPDSNDRASEILLAKKNLIFTWEPCIKTPWKNVQNLANDTDD